MAEKKTTRKVLSERALELVMLNVLGGLDGLLLQPARINQDSPMPGSYRANSRISGPVGSTSPNTVNLQDPQTDQKLSS